jgi:hypothetical protein
MTQPQPKPEPPAKKAATPPVGFLPVPGMAVRMKGAPQTTGQVIEHDEWWDTLLLRGVDIADQVLVDWTVPPGPPVVRWERVNQLEEVK